MRLSRSLSLSIRSDNRGKRGKKKHKRLDAICENVYNQSHRGVEEAEAQSRGVNAGVGLAGDELELRRSSRVRRAPVLLDASPTPARKRRKFDGTTNSGGSVERVTSKDCVKSESPCSTSRDLEEEEDSVAWKSRLRSRARNVKFRVGEVGDSSPRGKRKLFEDVNRFKERHKLDVEELDEKKGESEGEKLTVVKSKRPGRIKASIIFSIDQQGSGEGISREDDKEKNEVELLEDKDEDHLVLKNEMGCQNVGEVKERSSELVEEKETEVPNNLLSGECFANGVVQSVEQVKQLEQPFSPKEGVEKDTVEVDRVPCDQAEDEGNDDKALEDKNAKKVDKMHFTANDIIRKPRIKEGRRCGLCGGGTDGNPPKKLVHFGTGSDNEAYSGSSASEEPNYDIWDGFGDEPGWLGRLLGPINDRFGIAGIWVHQHCAVWSPEVYFAGVGCLKNVRAALCRGRVLKCSRCSRPGATIGCRVDRCPRTYHLPCARANGCIFDHRKFLIACTDHRHLFQSHGRYFYRLKKVKAKKVRLEMRKLSNDALRKDLEAEDKWLENCGEDEEFLKRESKRLHRDLLRIAPVYIGGSRSESEKQFQGWESVAGLQNVVQCLKEVVILPLLYPDFFNNMGLTPPRGVLLHGYPGTGKTLVVRALIGSCARGDKRIAYFARKGADCLGKYVGDAERQLRLLFQVAEKSQPSIIFFDEIDGLAPCRTRQQDQTHNSVVSTLLALMDGLKSRGSVVVIGATNRPDAVDPALRRPGRFDREIYFPLPSIKDREAILSLHTQNWLKPVTGSLLKWIAKKTVGFAGADLQALCTQAAIIALKRSCPLQKLLSTAGEKASHGRRPPLPTFTVDEKDWLEALSCAPPPCSRREAGMAANDVAASPLPAHLVPCLLQPLSRVLVSLYLDERIQLPPALSKAATLIKTVIVSALSKMEVQTDCWWSNVHGLLQDPDIAREVECSLSRASALVGDAYFAGFDGLNDDIGDSSLSYESSRAQNRGTRSGLLRNMSDVSGKESGFRILISGNSRTGQRHLASCILHGFVGNVQLRKVDLATISQEGHGDVVQGLTRIIMGCANVGSCMIFMPRIDLWAIEAFDDEDSDCPSTDFESSEKNDSNSTYGEVTGKGKNSCAGVCESAETDEFQDDVARPSHLWSSFTEQVESLCVSTSLMILATSDRPFPSLPLRIRQFFKSDMLNFSLSNPVEDTIPRFSIPVEGSFDSDTVLASSATKLTRDLAQHFIQLIHHEIHISSSTEDKDCGTVDVDIVCQNLNPEAGIEHGYQKCPDNPGTRLSFPPNKRNVKGKSNLLLAISTFGFQILQYPHFAELCWVTSKLKEGPCADINGPWKGWPFNSCIVRPNCSSETVAVPCTSSNIKSKETYGFVRGLIAVGLSAYRGVYTSLREVSSEVRNVLEILAGQINAKIEAGKDRYQFIRLLSQVAYFEDMVNNWAYTLRSLDADTQLTGTNPIIACPDSQDNHNTCGDNLVQADESMPGVNNKSLEDLEVLEETQPTFDAKTTGYVKGDESIGCPNLEVKNPISEEVPSHHSKPIVHLQTYSASADPVAVKLLNVENGDHTLVCGDLGSLQHSNGFACSDSAVFEDGPCATVDLQGVTFSTTGTECNLGNALASRETNILSEEGDGPNSCGDNVDINLSSNKSPGLPINSGVACFLHCCSKCLFKLHHLMLKILTYELGLKGMNWTVDDVHDVVTSLSVNLHSAIRKFCLVESSIISFDKNITNDKYSKLFGDQEPEKCHCMDARNGLILPMECSCHSKSKSANVSENPQQGLDLELFYRDGVLAALEPEKDVSFCCKFETLCLCSLIEWIGMTKQPLD